MRAHVVRERVRTYDSMHVHDRHNTGRMQPVKFMGVLNQLGFKLTIKETQCLVDYYTVGNTGEIDYRSFVDAMECSFTVSYTHLRAHETVLDLVCRLLLEKKK
eukprot:TRINITY_DN10792_c0_g1_i1.p1 TRINITY_DN10792_c0_g1~~TRINITY_DN10792_c0_g1_i1.p1  ORF type:complete len:103 (+),score=40.85 TRINITY_DN10792_c0_g1_i1:85-393(+)